MNTPNNKRKRNSQEKIEKTFLQLIQKKNINEIRETTKQLKEQSNLTEEMKNSDPLYWGGMMNNFKNQAEEIVGKELIYV